VAHSKATETSLKFTGDLTRLTSHRDITKKLTGVFARLTSYRDVTKAHWIPHKAH